MAIAMLVDSRCRQRQLSNMLKLVPDSLREAVFALGAPKWVVISKVTLRASLAAS